MTSDSVSVATLGPSSVLARARANSELERLQTALERYYVTGTKLCGRYRLYNSLEQHPGGQGLVQFARDDQRNTDCAIKFFLRRGAFERERALYAERQLRPLMAATQMVCDNTDGAIVAPDGALLPPFIILERGEALNEHVARERERRTGALGEDGNITLDDEGDDLATKLQAMMHSTLCVKRMHALGWAHRDLKPSNVLRVPRTHAWTLIDFGSAARIGEEAPLEFTPPYAAPEVLAAYEAGQKTVTADAAADVWALGLIAFEVFTETRVFPPGTARAEIFHQVTGRAALPWERQEGQALLQRLRGFKRQILQCLARDPAERPTAEAVLGSWRRLFDFKTVDDTATSSL